MDAVDVLTMAVDVARMIRSSADPDAVLREACRLIGCATSEGTEPLSLRVTRLVEGAGERRAELYAFLGTRRGPLYLNRPLAEWEREGASGARDPDPEVQALLAYVESEEARKGAIDLLGDTACPYKIGSREIVRYIELENVEQPKVVRGLIDYPLDQTVVFSIDLKSEMWYLWDILSAFSDQYARIYEDAERFGVWGHDLDDLWIDRLFYYPQKQLIYPYLSS
jgi:hypothetical protein